MADFLEKQGLGRPELIESSGGAFEVRMGDVLLFSKLREHRFPENTEIIDLIEERGSG